MLPVPGNRRTGNIEASCLQALRQARRTKACCIRNDRKVILLLLLVGHPGLFTKRSNKTCQDGLLVPNIELMDSMIYSWVISPMEKAWHHPASAKHSSSERKASSLWCKASSPQCEQAGSIVRGSEKCQRNRGLRLRLRLARPRVRHVRTVSHEEEGPHIYTTLLSIARHRPTNSSTSTTGIFHTNTPPGWAVDNIKGGGCPTLVLLSVEHQEEQTKRTKPRLNLSSGTMHNYIWVLLLQISSAARRLPPPHLLRI